MSTKLSPILHIYKGQLEPAFVSSVSRLSPTHLLYIFQQILAIVAAMQFAILTFALAAVLGSASAQLDGLSACAINCLVTSIPDSGCSLYVSDVLPCSWCPPLF